MGIRGRSLSILVHADTKVGKSTLCSTAPKPMLLLDAEAAHRFLPGRKIFWEPLRDAPPAYDGTWDICVVIIRDYSVMVRAVDWLVSGQHSFESVAVDSISEVQKKCFSPDTELLTAHGWCRIDELSGGAEVAQWFADGTINFVKPTDRQRLTYTGDLLSTPGVSSDLLVTPDHRQPILRAHGAVDVVEARDLRAGHVLPIAGCYAGARDVASPTDDEIRLLVAYQADGSDHGNKVQWSLKKTRKIHHLYGLLDRLKIEYSVRQYPEWREYKRIVIDRPEFFVQFMPNKIWEWDVLHWTFDARTVLVEELHHWDGWTPKQGPQQTGAGTYGGRVSYASKVDQNVDVICAVAAITGYGAATSVSNGVHVGTRIVRRTWRSLRKPQVRVPYDGFVHCVSVPSGFVLTRRNGKVTVSGNCKDQVASGGTQMDQQLWGTLLVHMEALMRRLRDLTEHPTNPITAIVVTAMTEERGGKWRPYVQGQLRTTMPYFMDVVGYLFVEQTPQLDPSQPPPPPIRRMLTVPHPLFEAGERVQGRLPAYVDDRCVNVSWMLDAVFGPLPVQEQVAVPAQSADSTAPPQ